MKINPKFKEQQPNNTNKCGGYALASVLSSVDPAATGDKIYDKIQAKQNKYKIDPTDSTNTQADPRIAWLQASVSSGTKMNMPSVIAAVAGEHKCKAKVLGDTNTLKSNPNFQTIYAAEQKDVGITDQKKYAAPADGTAHIILAGGGAHWVAGDCVGKAYHLYDSDPTLANPQTSYSTQSDYEAAVNKTKHYAGLYIELT